MSYYYIEPDNNNIEPIVTTLRAATEEPINTGQDVVLLTPNKAQVTSPAIRKSLEELGFKVESDTGRESKMNLMINNTKVTISYVGNEQINLKEVILVGLWGGIKMLELLDEAGRSNPVIYVPWNKDKEMHTDESPEDLWIKQKEAVELPLEILKLG